MKKDLKFIDSKLIYQGKWLQFEEVMYKNNAGETSCWEYVKRTQDRGAVVIIGRLLQSDRYVLVRQYRPPVKNYIFEFPAGLIDKGETYESTAIRELEEETGYIGKVRKVTAPVYNTPGLTDETVAIAFVDIDESLPENLNPEQKTEVSEDIEVFLVNKNDLYNLLLKREEMGDCIDAKIMTFALAAAENAQ